MCEAKSGFCLGMSLVTLGGILLCILLAEKIPSYLHTKDFVAAECLVQHTAFIGNVCCDITQHEDLGACRTVYPCFRTQVLYSDEDDQERTGTLFKNFKTYAYQHDAMVILVLLYFRC